MFFSTSPYRNIFLGETFSSYISVHNDSSQVVKDILVKVQHIITVEHWLLTDQRQSWLSCTCWSPPGRPADQLPEAQLVGVKLRSSRTQTRLLHRWCDPPRSERNRNTHVCIFLPVFWLHSPLFARLKQRPAFFPASSVQSVTRVSMGRSSISASFSNSRWDLFVCRH